MKKYKILFCDLDGTLIEPISGKTLPKGIWDMKLKFEVFDAIKKLNPEYIFIVSNQGGIEKGFVYEPTFKDKIEYISSCIYEYCNNVTEVSYLYCSTNDKNNKFRKPNPGMLEKFYQNNKFNKENALMIGDASGLKGQWSDTDKQTAINFGIDYMDVNEFVNNYVVSER